VTIQISGTVGASYAIERSNLGASNSWTILTNLTLSGSPGIAVDTLAAAARFYRAVSWP